MTDTDETRPALTNGPARHRGSCHCGAVRFEIVADLAGRGASRCNCSICTKLGTLGGSMKPDALTLLAGEDALASYEWGAKISRRYFCKRCGVHCFGRGHLAELGGDYASVNYNCLDGVELTAIPVVYWDGRNDNWDAGPRPTPWPVLSGARRAGIETPA